MRINNDNTNNKIKVQIKKINDDSIECRHITSNYAVKAFITKGMKFEIGQVVQLEYRTNSGGSGYVVVDDLMEEIEMQRDVFGTWVVTKFGDLHGVYYTYFVVMAELLYLFELKSKVHGPVLHHDRDPVR